MIFISGPLVVSPSEMINIQANLFGQKLSNAKWWKTKDSSPKEIEFDSRKYFTYQSKKIQKIEIHNADKEDSAVYQLSMDGTKSNKINVFVDGMYAQICLSSSKYISFNAKNVNKEALLFSGVINGLNNSLC